MFPIPHHSAGRLQEIYKSFQKVSVLRPAPSLKGNGDPVVEDKETSNVPPSFHRSHLRIVIALGRTTSERPRSTSVRRQSVRKIELHRPAFLRAAIENESQGRRTRSLPARRL